jgi:hypothetical protein
VKPVSALYLLRKERFDAAMLDNVGKPITELLLPILVAPQNTCAEACDDEMIVRPGLEPPGLPVRDVRYAR